MRTKVAFAGIVAVVLLCGPLTGCRSVQSCGSSLQAFSDMPGLWNSIKRMSNPRSLERWVNRFLSSLLHNGRYQLEAQGGTFIVIDPKDSHESRCQMPMATQRRMLKDPIFLQRLYNIVSKHNFRLKDYRYQPPQMKVVQSKGTKIWGGNCNMRKFRVEASYWKAISTIYTRNRWKEACKIGKELKKWRECFDAAFLKMYKKRMKRTCS